MLIERAQVQGYYGNITIHHALQKKAISQWFFGGPKLGKKSRKFQQISDTKSCGYVRNLVRFGVNVISFEGGGRWFSLFDRILVFGLNKESKAKFSPTFCHLQRKSSCHMEFLAIFSLAILSGKQEVQESTKNYCN